MITYLPGQIEEKHRGNMVAIIKTGENKLECFCCDPDTFFSKHDRQPTEIMHENIKRVYIGIDHPSAKSIINKIVNEFHGDETRLKEIDEELVLSEYIKKPEQKIDLNPKFDYNSLGSETEELKKE